MAFGAAKEHMLVAHHSKIPNKILLNLFFSKKRKATKAEGVIIMSDHHTYKKVEIVGSSKNSIDEAIRNGIAECARSVKNIEWFEVVETRGHVQDGNVAHFQVAMKVGFRIENS